MKYSSWIGFIACLLVLLACYRPFVLVPSIQLEIAGMYASGPHNYGKPGLMNLMCSAASAVFFLLPFIWAKRTNIFFCGFNLAWAIRNYLLLSKCYNGECPVKLTGLYLLLVASAVMLLMSFLPDIKIKDNASA